MKKIAACYMRCLLLCFCLGFVRVSETRAFESSLDLSMGAFAHNQQRNRHLQLNSYYQPFFDRNRGVFASDDSFVYTRANIMVKPWEFLQLKATPYFIVSQDGLGTKATFSQIYGSLLLRNLAVDVGYVPLFWGYGQYQSMLLSHDFRPFFTVRMRNQRPIVLDGWLSFLGEANFETFWGRLKGDRQYANGQVVGFYFSFDPSSQLNVHIGGVTLYGGEGAPTNNPAVVFSELFIEDDNPANRNFIVGLAWKPKKMGIKVYGDIYIEDCCKKYNWFNARDTMHLAGFEIPELGEQGNLSIGMEWARTNNITYIHRFNMTHRNRILGHSLGPDATGVYLMAKYKPTVEDQLQFVWASEIRGRLGEAASRFGGRDIRVVEPSYEVPETRLRGEFSWNRKLNQRVSLMLRTGVEKVNHFQNIEYNNRWNYLLQWETTVAF